VDVLRRFRGSSDFTAETCPHYLSFTEDDVARAGVCARINPPVRHEADRAALWEALADGTLAHVTTDHAAFAPEEKAAKEGDFLTAPPGHPGLETLVPTLLDAVAEGRMPIERASALLSGNAAARFRLPTKGRLAAGADADMIVVDMGGETHITEATLLTNARAISRLTHGAATGPHPAHDPARRDRLGRSRPHRAPRHRALRHPGGPAMTEPLLSVRDLQTTFVLGRRAEVRAVDGVSFDVFPGETLAIVGESGSGKSVTSLSIMRLLPAATGKITGGHILFRGRDLASLSEREMRAIRGREIGMIFQEPMTSLNPVHTIGDQIAETVIRHEGVSRAKGWSGRWRCWRSSASPSRGSAPRTTRTRCRGACASAR
jgi:ABC-type multidrug transport system fused ATPase/permease subunit